mmetsp:Transcript_18072/g.45277  ORF Transcript_18072/g.45277 Transcript_18072/m.45277 type:complete len:224 (-) Transcript_18072:1329-2000(-)
MCCPRQDPSLVLERRRVQLFHGRPFHCVRFPTAGLTVRQDGDLVAIERRFHELRNLLEDLLLRGIRVEYAVEVELPSVSLLRAPRDVEEGFGGQLDNSGPLVNADVGRFPLVSSFCKRSNSYEHPNVSLHLDVLVEPFFRSEHEQAPLLRNLRSVRARLLYLFLPLLDFGVLCHFCCVHVLELGLCFLLSPRLFFDLCQFQFLCLAQHRKSVFCVSQLLSPLV